MFGRVTEWHFHAHRTPSRVSMDSHDGRNRSYLRVSSEMCSTVPMHTVHAVVWDLKRCTLVDTLRRIYSVLNGSFVTVPPCRTSCRHGTGALGIEVIAVVHDLCFSATSTAIGTVLLRSTSKIVFYFPNSTVPHTDIVPTGLTVNPTETLLTPLFLPAVRYA